MDSVGPTSCDQSIEPILPMVNMLTKSNARGMTLAVILSSSGIRHRADGLTAIEIRLDLDQQKSRLSLGPASRLLFRWIRELPRRRLDGDNRWPRSYITGYGAWPLAVSPIVLNLCE